MANTVTAFYNFVPRTRIKSAEVNDNFSNVRGDLIPIDPNTATAAGLTYGLGTSEHRWGSSFIEDISFGQTTTGWQIVQETTTGGLLQLKKDGAVAVEFNETGVLGVSGGGGLDVFHTQNFENTGASYFSVTGNTTTVDDLGSGTFVGTLVTDAASELNGDQSVRYTQSTGSANDFFLGEPIVLKSKQKNKAIGATFYYTYDGDDDDIRFVVYDTILNEELTRSDVYLKNATTATRFETAIDIPSDAEGIIYGFQVSTENPGAILVVDDFEFSTDPFKYSQLEEIEAWKDAGTITIGGTTSAPTKGTTVTDKVWYRRVGDSLEVKVRYEQSSAGTAGSGDYLIQMPSGFKIDTTKTGVYTTVVGTGSWDPQAYVGIGGYQNTTSQSSHVLVSVYDEDNVRVFLSNNLADGAFSSGFGGLGTSPLHFEFVFTVPIQGWSATSEHVVTAAQSSETRTKFLSADVTATDTDIADLKFTDLVVGNWYHVNFVADVTWAGTNSNAVVEIIHDGNTIRKSTVDSVSTDTGGTNTMNVSTIFQATTTDLIFSFTDSSTFELRGNGTLSESHVQLTNLTTQFLAAIPVQDSEHARFYGVAGFSSNNTSALYFSTEQYNDISTLGTLANSSADGWSFTASVPVEVTVALALHRNSGNTSYGITYNPSASTLDTDITSVSAGDIYAGPVSSSQGTDDGVGTATNTFKMAAGDVIYAQGIKTHTYSGDANHISLFVRRQPR